MLAQWCFFVGSADFLPRFLRKSIACFLQNFKCCKMLCAHLMCFGRQRSSSIIVMLVAFAELEAVKISSIVTVVVCSLCDTDILDYSYLIDIDS
jgi:hypothetical protein